jgi:lysophospholipase L1-like esterase
MPVPNQQHVFYRGTDGHIHHILWDTFTARLYADVWTAGAHSPLAAGNPAALATPGQQHVFYRGQDRHIHHIVWVGEKRRLYRDVWTLRAGAPPAAGDPVAMETPGQQHVFYRGADGGIHHILWTSLSPHMLFHDDWRARAEAPTAAGDPATLVTAEGQQHVFYRGMDGEIIHILWDPSSPQRLRFDDWTIGAQAPMAAGNLAAMATVGQQHVFYRGVDGAINHILWASLSGRLHHDDWRARAHAPAAAGDPATMMTAEGQQHVFYRGVGGEINHIFWDPSSPQQLRADDWTSRAQAAPAAGAPAPLVFSGQQHVFYRGSGGAVDHILWDPSSPNTLWCDDWTSKASAPMAAGNPATLLSSDSATDYTWKILPLGDSITEGLSLPVPYWGGYRVRLFATATHWGKRMTFVGSRFNGPADVEGVPFPRSHEGHSGKDINYIASIVPDALKSEPDIILLMIGTNDILQDNHLDEAPDRLATLLEKIIAADVGALIVVAQITPLPKHSIEVTKYNEGVAVVVRKLADRGERVLLADMHTGYPLSLLSPDPDNTHPTQQGYDHMAAVWYAAIDTTLT